MHIEGGLELLREGLGLDLLVLQLLCEERDLAFQVAGSRALPPRRSQVPLQRQGTGLGQPQLRQPVSVRKLASLQAKRP